MLSIVYSPDLEIIGAVTVILLAGWFLNACWHDVARARARRRRRQRRGIERALVARTRCADCGSKKINVETPTPTDRQLVAGALGGYLRRARTEASAR